MKRKIFTLLLCGFMGTMVMAQEARTGGVKKTATAPVVDGVIDDVWATANTYSIDIPFLTETPTLGDPGTTTWKALWTDDGVYILLTVNDDVWYPSYATGGNSWEYDKPEIYFDVNAEKVDAGGASGGNGHYQVAPAAELDKIDGTPTTGTDGVVYAFKVADPAWVAEYFIPFSKLLDKAGNDLDIFSPIGFDVTIIDRDAPDPGRMRANWSNLGAINESWNNMDGCGTVTLDPIPLEGNVIKKTAAAPVIDGVVDAIWSTSNVFNIDKPFKAETPTLGESGTTTWKALWSDDGLYILVQVNDDEFYPAYMNNATATWNYDMPEIYFDVNPVKNDGVGGGGGKGHYQVVPTFGDGSKNDGTPTTGTDGIINAFKVTAPTYVGEYFIPWTKLVDQAGVDFDKSTPMGFDVTVIDGESAVPGVRQRAVWSNDGNGPSSNESWANMDDCATIVFEGTQDAVLVDVVSLAGGTITADNGTLQMTYTIQPSNASNKKVKWTVENGTGRATINADGLLTALIDGNVTVKGAARDGGYAEGTAVVTISGQIVKLDEISMIKNGNFELGTDGKESWGGPGTVEDGWYNFECTPKVYIWDTMFGQPNLPVADATTPYTVKFKAVASSDMLVPMLFEDRLNGSNNKALTSISPYRGADRWDIPVTTEAKWFEVDVIFSALLAGSAMELNFQVGMNDGTLSLDSIQMFADADKALLSTSAQLIAANTMKVYPNPVGSYNELTVSLTAINAKVSIYNAMGQKLIEKTAIGNIAKFDVTSLRKGMYFVRLDNGTVQKFVR